MIIRRYLHQSLLFRLSKSSTRHLHARVRAAAIPSPTPFVPDVATFLTLIGRESSKYTSKIPSWEALFSLSSQELRDLGVEPARNRRYLLRWRDLFRKKKYGVGGDLSHVGEDGIAEFRVVTVPRELLTDKKKAEAKQELSTPFLEAGMRQIIVNAKPGEPELEVGKELVGRRIKWLRLRDGLFIQGSNIEPVKGTVGKVAQLKVKEGLWEHKRGKKIDGGERRQAEIRAKRRGAERKAQAAEAAKAAR